MNKKKQKNSETISNPRSNRAVTVFVSLVGMVAATVVLLAVLAPTPLVETVWLSMYAIDGQDTPESSERIFQTDVPTTASRWNFIYIHHSRTLSGNAATLQQQSNTSDHFVIGNGDGCVDGEVEITQSWNHQQSITTPPDGVSKLAPDCISICVVGDFDRTLPTPRQQLRLNQLVDTLQSRLKIPARGVQFYDVPSKAAGIGHAFPVAGLKAQILP